MLTVGKSSGALAVTGRADEGLGIVEYPGPGAGRAGDGDERGTGPPPVVPWDAGGAGRGRRGPVAGGVRRRGGRCPQTDAHLQGGPGPSGRRHGPGGVCESSAVRDAGPLGPHLRRRGLRRIFRQARVAGRQSRHPWQAWSAGRDEPLDVPRAAAGAHRAGHAAAIAPVRSVSRSHQVNRMGGAPGCLPEPRFPAVFQAAGRPRTRRGRSLTSAAARSVPPRRTTPRPLPLLSSPRGVRASAAARSSASVVPSLSAPAQAM